MVEGRPIKIMEREGRKEGRRQRERENNDKRAREKSRMVIGKSGQIFFFLMSKYQAKKNGI